MKTRGVYDKSVSFLRLKARSPLLVPSYSHHIPIIFPTPVIIDDELYSPTMMKEKNNILKLTICIPITFE